MGSAIVAPGFLPLATITNMILFGSGGHAFRRRRILTAHRAFNFDLVRARPLFLFLFPLLFLLCVPKQDPAAQTSSTQQ
jgi:hypothetical protein